NNLIKTIRIRQKLVVVEFENERNLVRVLSRDRAQHSERGGDGVTAAFDCEFHDVLRIKVLDVRRERSPGRVLDTLIDGQYREVPGAGEAPVIKHCSEVSQHLRPAIRARYDAIEKVRAGQVKHVFGNGIALMSE